MAETGGKNDAGYGESDSKENNVLPIANGNYFIMSHNSGYVLDVLEWNKSDGARIIQYPLHGGSNQIFQLIGHKDDKTGYYDGYYSVECIDSGKFWDITGASKDNSAELIQWKYHGGDNQLFKFDSLGNGLYRIKCKHSDKVLDISGASKQAYGKCIQYGYHGANNQRFRLLPAKPI